MRYTFLYCSSFEEQSLASANDTNMNDDADEYVDI